MSPVPDSEPTNWSLSDDMAFGITELIAASNAVGDVDVCDEFLEVIRAKLRVGGMPCARLTRRRWRRRSSTTPPNTAPISCT